MRGREVGMKAKTVTETERQTYMKRKRKKKTARKNLRVSQHTRSTLTGRQMKSSVSCEL